MLKSGLSVWCYTAPGQQYYPQAQTDYSRLVESLRFTTIQPGGFGQLSCTIRVPSARLPRYELAMFSRIVVMAPATAPSSTAHALWIGEITQPELVNDTQGEYFNIQALGIGNCLRDDPRNVSYTNQNPQAIINAEMTANNRATWMPISTDQSQIFPNNPVTTFSPSYMGLAMEDIINDVCLLAGDVAWGVWAHPTQKDSFGFPLGQLYVHTRNPNQISYQAFMATSDFASWRVTPAADRAYNSMAIAYADPGANNNYGIKTATDSRLGASLQQQTAPFRYRRYWQDFSGVSTVGGTQAQAIENTQLGIMKNPSNKIQMVLKQIRNSGAQPIPLWSVQADQTIQAPELVQRSTVLGDFPEAGVNLFYILSAEYAENSSGEQQLTLQCDNWYDYGQTRLARLELAAYRKAQNGTTTAQIQSAGAPDVGKVGFQTYNANAGATFGQQACYHTQMANNPTSITLSGGGTTNASSVTVNNIDTYSFFFTWTAAATGATICTRIYQTNGNCVRSVDLEADTFAHHCDCCDQTRENLSIMEHCRIEVPFAHRDYTDGTGPGEWALMVDCPCGASEGFNTALTADDEIESDGNHGTRAGLAREIRKLCAHAGIQASMQAKAAAAKAAVKAGKTA